MFASPPPFLNGHIWDIHEINDKSLGKKVFEYDKTSTDKTTKYTEKKSEEINFEDLEILFANTNEKISDFNNWLKTLAEQEKALCFALSKIDLEKADIEHAIELGVFNASEGYLLCKQLQEIMQRRRIIKDAIYLLPSIREAHKALTPFVTHLNERTYTPKVLKSLKIREIKSTKKKSENDH